MGNRILVIDDEPDYRFIVGEVLRPAGFEVEEAGNGAEALAILKRQRPDLILLDWNMPELDGEEFCRLVRAEEHFQNLPIIMMTVKAGTETELEALHFGVDDFINKPFAASELLARVNALLRRTARR